MTPSYCGFAVWLWMGTFLPQVKGNLLQPWKWTISRWEDNKVVQTWEGAGDPGFTVHSCDLAPITPCLNLIPVYMCPSSNPSKSYCNSPGQYYCPYWGCETLATAWEPSSPDPNLQLSWGPKGCTPLNWYRGGDVTCQYLILNVTAPRDSGWTLGRTWGFRYWEDGVDRGGVILIKKEMILPKTTPSSHPSAYHNQTI